MKKFTFLLSLLFVIVSLQAQDYLINFAGTGASTTVGTVTVENLTQGKSITISGTEMLHLAKIVTGLDPIQYRDKNLLIYPNPTKGNSTLEFVATASGKANIELFDISGKRVVTAQASLQIGTNSFQISGLGNGIFTVRISSQEYTYTGKMVSNGTPSSKVEISYIGNNTIPVIEKMLKSTNAEKAMQYNTGDRLKIIGTSGIYSTVIVDIPTQNKTLTFNFIECTDADGNNYPVVQIGTQVWMAENLKTTKYNDGADISNVTDKADWISLITGAYCWYQNDISNKNTFGALYNWHSINSGKLAPKGWHVLSISDWTTLTDYLTNNGYGDPNNGRNTAKALSATWAWNPFVTIGTVGRDLFKNNSSGFTALPGGVRLYNTGNFYDIYNNGYWWSSKAFDTDRASWLYLRNDDVKVTNQNGNKGNGLSVRCIKD